MFSRPFSIIGRDADPRPTGYGVGRVDKALIADKVPAARPMLVVECEGGTFRSSCPFRSKLQSTLHEPTLHAVYRPRSFGLHPKKEHRQLVSGCSTASGVESLAILL